MLIENFKRYYLVLQKVYNNLSESMETVQVELLKVLRDQKEAASENDEILEGIYLEAALTDELFIPKFTDWKKNMLEHQLFNSQNSGDKFVENLKKLIDNPLDYTREHIRLYFLVLSLGFKGKLTKSAAMKYKAHLHQMLFTDDTKQSKYLIDENFAFTQTRPPKGFVPSVRSWIKVVGVAFFVYVCITSVYWFYVQRDMKDIVDVLAKKTKVELQ
ncbi:MAG: DotU family type IV/VI secretion system protein [Alphaproteobacteria bacterium]|nr:MAG: DotU family type IV/VI secretion system protein [Alphaproteobacteria bacterium]